jgi:WD40 repeat protein
MTEPEPLSASRPWGVLGGGLRRLPLHVTFVGHQGYVKALCPLRMSGGAVHLASAGNDGLIRVWNLETAEPVGPPLHGHEGSVEALVSLTQIRS